MLKPYHKDMMILVLVCAQQILSLMQAIFLGPLHCDHLFEYEATIFNRF